MCYNLWADGSGRNNESRYERRDGIVYGFFRGHNFPGGKCFGVLPSLFAQVGAAPLQVDLSSVRLLYVLFGLLLRATSASNRGAICRS